jgi:hypothetical protein
VTNTADILTMLVTNTADILTMLVTNTADILTMLVTNTADILTVLVTSLLLFQLIQASVINTIYINQSRKCTFTKRIFSIGNNSCQHLVAKTTAQPSPYYVRLQPFFRPLTTHLEYCFVFLSK